MKKGLPLVGAVLLLLSYEGVNAQQRYRDFLPKKPQHHLGGWQFAPGLTYSPSMFLSRKEELGNFGDSSLVAEMNAGGRLGLYAEFGRYRMVERLYVVRMIDYGVAYKSIGGNEKFENYFNTSENKIPINEGKSKFRNHIASAYFNASHVKQIGKYHMIMNSLGLNFDYQFLGSRDYQQNAPVPTDFTGPFNLQVHYKFGYGIKLRGEWIMIPSIETPIFNIWSFTNGIPGIKAFSSTYQPFILSLKFMLLRPVTMNYCPPVKSISVPEGVEKQE